MFKKLLLTASALAVAALVLVMVVSCVSASDEIATFEVCRHFPLDWNYQVISTTSTVGDPDYKPNFLFVKNVDDLKAIKRVQYDGNVFIDEGAEASGFTTGPLRYRADDGVIVGNVTCGYTSGSGSVSYYQFWINDLNDNLDDYDGEEFFYFSSPGGTWHLDNWVCAITRDYIFYGLGAGEMCFASLSGASYYWLGWDSAASRGLESHVYRQQLYHTFYNFVRINEIAPGYYEILIQREGDVLSGFSTSSMAHIWDDNYTYFNQSAYKDTNQSSYATTSICGGLNVELTDVHGKVWTHTFSDFCTLPDYGTFDLSGYTRSVTGNLIPGVLLTAQGESTYSNNISFYEFQNLDTGSFDLAWNKTGYWNDSVSMYIGTPGSYERDVYLIPLDALEEGEFGGVVYDFCTHQSIQGAYVYLFNETADSGKYAYSNKYGFYRFAGMTEGLDYEVSASKDGYDGSIVHSFTFNESNVNETHRKTKNIWLLPEDGCPEDGGIPTPPPAPTSPPHEWTNEEIVSWLRVNLMGLFIIVLIVTFMWFLRKAGGSRR